MDTSFCHSKNKPADISTCNQQDCKTQQLDSNAKVANNWEISEWSECSVSCGTGFKFRNVTCISNDCVETSKPLSKDRCQRSSCPNWNFGQWSPCFSEKKCGMGWQVRLVVCQVDTGNVLSNDQCNQAFRPISNRTCHLKKCPDDARWVTAPYQPCSVSCGQGIQYRYITCEDADGLSLNENRCLSLEKKPTQQRPCTRELCSQWVPGDWGACDSQCLQHRSIQCMKGMAVVDYNFCNHAKQPEQERDCQNPNCVSLPKYSWHIGQWSLCSKTCAYGTRVRKITCVDEHSVIAGEENCQESKPVSVEHCFEGLCPSKWVTRAWSKCSVTCGEGTMTRRVVCIDSNGQPQQSGKSHTIEHHRLRRSIGCSQIDKPKSVRSCNLGNCGNQYRWSVHDWTPCSRSCGIGESHRKVECVNEYNILQLESLCPDKMPSNYKSCNTHTCPAKSCRDIQLQLGISYDGEHQILIGNGDIIDVYCEGMNRNNPREFVTLKADPRDNFSEIYGKRLREFSTCPEGGRRLRKCENCLDYDSSGLTFFKKVRIDVRRMVIIPEDQTFSDRFGTNPPGFASAGDCYSNAKCPQGRFMINLTGTGLMMHPKVKWISRGWDTTQNIRIMDGRQIVYGKCGGYCGMCNPDHGLKVLPVRTSEGPNSHK